MLLCRACNTRFEDGQRACPSCGRAAERAAEAGSSGSSQKAAAASGNGALPPAQALEDEVDVDLELSQVVVEEKPRPARPARRKSGSDKSGANASGRTVIGLDPGQVRALIAEQPGLLEKGLGIHSDEEGNPVGVDFDTPVGGIDLLARDTKGNLVVVMVPDVPELDGIVPEIVQRIGWVRKHLADDADVRGIAVMDNLPETVGYAAAGVAGMVTFKTFRVALTFQEIRP